ncbi:MAG: DUF2752 domain-containing protein [Anaerolineaceae bacterium]
MQYGWRREPSFLVRGVEFHAALSVIALACLCAAFALSPTTVGTGPTICPFRLATGLPCPGCGLTRSWVALAHGRISASFNANLFGPLAFGLTAAALALTLSSPFTGVSPNSLSRLRFTRVAAKGLVGTWIVWAVLRAVGVAVT